VAFRHVVLFRVHDGIANERVSAAIESLQSLAGLPGVLAFVIARSLDARKGRIIVEDATFADAAASSAFRASPAHVAVAGQLAQISDWWIGDYEAREQPA